MSAAYDFHERLAMSHGYAASDAIGQILLSHIFGSVSVDKAAEKDDRNGTDWWVTLANGHALSVDCKVREQDWAERGSDDLALETWSVVERQIIGWTRDHNKRTDYILWFWKDTKRWCLLPFRMLCKVFSDKWQEWKERYRTALQRTPGRTPYHSECVFVPRREVWAAIYQAFGSNRHQPQEVQTAFTTATQLELFQPT